MPSKYDWEVVVISYHIDRLMKMEHFIEIFSRGM